jgi:hypothetical protein
MYCQCWGQGELISVEQKNSKEKYFPDASRDRTVSSMFNFVHVNVRIGD